MKLVHVLFAGSVQGVGFRFSAVDIANRYGVTGWVRNTGEGTVEVVAEGTEQALQSFLNELNTKMSDFIRAKKISWEPVSGLFSDFQIKY